MDAFLCYLNLSYLINSEVQQLREAVDTSTKTGKCDSAILDVMFYTGLRREEVSSLMLSDFVLDKGQWCRLLR
jgi:site-specific recombinase XerD